MKMTRLMLGGALALFIVGAAIGCGSAGEDSSSGNGGSSGKASYPSEDFWAGFKEIPPKNPPNEVVDTAPYEKPASKKLVIAYADSSLSNSWRVMTKADTEEGIAGVGGAGAKLVYTNANDSAPKQISDMEDLIAQHVDAIVISAVDVNAVCPSIEKALDAGIPVIVQERAVDCENYTSFVSLDMVNVAENQMAYIVDRLEGKGEVALIYGIPGVGHTVQGEEGYENVLEENPEIDVVDEQYAKYDPAQAKQLAASILVAHPNVEAFGVISGLMTDGVYEAVEAAGKVDQIKAWDGDDANGWMTLAVEHDLPNMTVPYPTKVGSVSVEVAVAALRGEKVEKTTYVPRWEPAVEFSENLAEFANFEKPAEWWYTEMSCEFDPFCKS
ncbi:MAG: substrate-binding domain-containing protein [Solirubrobacterales bacterium]